MNRIKLYCLPYAGGSKYVYNDWIRIYSEAAEIIPIEYSGHGERYGEPFYRSADEAAEDIAEMIMSDKPERYALYGHSLGGTLGFLVTKKLEEDYSCKPLTLMIGGSRPPHLKYKNEKWLSLSKNEFMQRIYMMGQTDESIMKEKELYENISVGTKLRCGSVILEVTQIGKECHSGCEISKRTGRCIMPKEGIFTRVLKGGPVQVGDNAEIFEEYRLGVITASDKGSKGERIDKSGPLISDITKEWGYKTVCSTLLPDDEDALYAEIVRMCDVIGCDIVITTGGTGLSQRDRTPEATLRAATRQAPGIAEAIRSGSLKVTPMAMLSRGVSVIRNRTLIVNLPGSPKAVKESLEIILPALSHGVDILKGNTGECAG